MTDHPKRLWPAFSTGLALLLLTALVRGVCWVLAYDHMQSGHHEGDNNTPGEAIAADLRHKAWSVYQGTTTAAMIIIVVTVLWAAIIVWMNRRARQ
ncbi:hypothetical protein [Streptomyces sp. WAC 06783]|uniref:hypothetical protein n=1 Tax=Streptomyces sp. WAC 06783 TaxID=2203211 RepID=UPI000F744284|nr:hypothetical protein [Streptomyces sp. WAC 06783]